MIASTPLAQPQNPFPGLRSFEPEDSHLFFGRDQQIEEVLARIQRTRFLAVIGGSGSGKSSLVRAGLIPGLKQGYVNEAGARWRIALLRPGNDPTGSLANALATPGHGDIRSELERSSEGLLRTAQDILAPNENLLVVVDQFEEIFRFRAAMREQGNSDPATAFVKLLLPASQQEKLPVYIVLTMRSDFLGDCTQFRGLPEALNAGQYLVPRMNRDQQKEAIEGPVAVGQATITSALVQRLLNDVQDDPDQLPVLQHALMRTWDQSRPDRARGQSIDSSHYEVVGGMSQALNRHADDAYNALGGDDREIARKIFQRLTDSTRGQAIRRPTSMQELCLVTLKSDVRIAEIINTFRTHGRTFLTSTDGFQLNSNSIIDISHESLIRLWSKLREWVTEEAESAKIYKRLAESALANRALYRNQDLRQALDWKERAQPTEAWAKRYNSGFDRAMAFLKEVRAQNKHFEDVVSQ